MSELKTVHTGEEGHQGLKVMIYVRAKDRTHRGGRAPGTRGNDLSTSTSNYFIPFILIIVYSLVEISLFPLFSRNF